MTLGSVRFWWVRHGPVATEGRITGQRDVAVDLSDTATLAALAHALPHDPVLVATPLSRTQLTAHALFGRDADCLEVDLLEQDFGRWSDFTWDQVSTEATAMGYWDDPIAIRPPGGENVLDLCRRVGHFLEKAVTVWAGRDVVCVCHGGTIRAALAHALGVSDHPAPVLRLVIDPLSLTRTDVFEPGSSQIMFVNQTFKKLEGL